MKGRLFLNKTRACFKNGRSSHWIKKRPGLKPGVVVEAAIYAGSKEPDPPTKVGGFYPADSKPFMR